MHHLNNPGLARNALNRSRLASFVADSLIRLESLVGDIHVDWGSYRLFEMPAGNLRMSNFQTDEHCENWTRFKKDKLFDLIGRIGLEEQVYVLRRPGHYHVFHREELLMHTLTKLSHGLPHTVMSDMVAGGNSQRWSDGHNYVIGHLDETFIDLVSINSLNIWVNYFPSFAESIRLKNCSYWEEEDEELPDA